MANRPCLGCGRPTSRSRCSRCQPPKLPTAARGYGPEHRAERERWAPIVAGGQASCMEIVCLKRDRYIAPGDPWDLAHAPGQAGYLGPAHPACNRSAGDHARRRATA